MISAVRKRGRRDETKREKREESINTYQHSGYCTAPTMLLTAVVSAQANDAGASLWICSSLACSVAVSPKSFAVRKGRWVPSAAAAAAREGQPGVARTAVGIVPAAPAVLERVSASPSESAEGGGAGPFAVPTVDIWFLVLAPVCSLWERVADGWPTYVLTQALQMATSHGVHSSHGRHLPPRLAAISP